MNEEQLTVLLDDLYYHYITVPDASGYILEAIKNAYDKGKIDKETNQWLDDHYLTHDAACGG